MSSQRTVRKLSDGPKKLTCKFCGDIVHGWGNLRRHINRKHSKQSQSVTPGSRNTA